MTVEHQGAMVALVPHTHGVVRKNKMLSLIFDLKIGLAGGPTIQFANLITIVIAPNQVDFAIQASDDIWDGGLAHSEIAKMIYVIIRADDRVPIRDHQLVHFLNAFWREIKLPTGFWIDAVAVFDNVAMAPMRIARVMLFVHEAEHTLMFQALSTRFSDDRIRFPLRPAYE